MCACAGNAHRKRISRGKACVCTPDCLWHLLPAPSLSKASRYKIRPPSPFPRRSTRVSSRTRAHVRKRSHTKLFYLICLSRAPTYEHLGGVHRLRLIPMCLLKPSVPFRRRAWEPRSLDAPIPQKKFDLAIRLSSRYRLSSLTTPTFCNFVAFPFAPRRKGHCDNDCELFRRESTQQSPAQKLRA